MNWKICDTTHYFANIECALPRVELPRRALRELEYEEWKVRGDFKDRGSGQAKEKGCRIVERSARACVDADDIVLQPARKQLSPLSGTGLWNLRWF